MSRSHRPTYLAIALCFAILSAAASPMTKVTTVASSTGAHDLLKESQAVAVDLPSGVLFIADTGHHQIARIVPSGTVTVLAGSGEPGKTDGIGAAAQFKQPQGIAIDSVRRLIYVADTSNHLIRRITFDGVVSTVAGSGRGEDRDGIGTDASFHAPVGLALDPAGNLYVADSGNDKIRIVSPAGNVATLAGTGRPGYGDGAASLALFKGPRGLTVSSAGDVYVADTQNHVIRKIANGVVSTFAGTTHGGNIDGAADVAEFKHPSGVVLDDSGNLWVADTLNHRVRRIGTDGVTTTIAGDGKPGYVDGSDLLRAAFHQPTGITAAGGIYIADSKNDAVRLLVPPLSVTDFQPRSGTPNGGDTVRVFGSGFIPGRTEVTFGGVAAPSVSYVSSTELLVLTPPHPIGDAEVRVATVGGSNSFAFPFRYVPPFVSIPIAPASATLDISKTVQFTALGVSPDGSATDLTGRVTWSSANAAIVTIESTGVARGVAVGSTTITATFESLSRTAAVTVRSPEPIPPEPVPSAIDPTVVSDMSKSVQFLYTGPNAIQKNVTSGAINTRRVAVLRGRVLAPDGSPIAGVRVSDTRSFFGFTLTRGDGMYDFAVNGGGDITLAFTKSGLIPAQRRVATPWRDYVVLDDVYMTSYDANATVVQMGSPTMQVAQGSLVTDSDGVRRATLLIPSGTTATIQTVAGSQPASSLTIRATEFSVGPNGPNLMPANLPATSAYTYCVELSTDEAVAANALRVNFSTPLGFYVENFLNFPVGTTVPTGYYDRTIGAWIPSENGIVLKIITIDDGAATVDITGDGSADDATALGISGEELQKLADTYAAGQTLWRTPITHFTPFDLNFPYVLPPGAAPPQQPQPTWYKGVEQPDTRCGSTIDCHNQVFGETIPIDGTSLSLQYQSDHAPGYTAGHSVEIPISGPAIPEPLQRIDVEVRIQGRLFRQSFPAEPNQTYRFTWDGLDAYGRDLQGLQIARIRVGYVYDGFFARPPELPRAFGATAGDPISTIANARQEFTFWQTAQALIGHIDDRPLGFGGWTLDALRTLEPASGIVHGGAAAQRTGDLQRSMIDRFAGGGTAFGNGDFGFARDARFQLAWAIAVAPNGVVYVSDWSAGTIRQISTNGIISTARANVGNVSAMAVGPDDALYYAVGGTIWRRDPFSLAVTLVAGQRSLDYTIDTDGVLAINAFLGTIEALAFGPDGSLYVADGRLRRIGADGVIYGVTGPTALPRSSNPEGGAALATNAGPVKGLAVGIDGTIYFTVAGNGRIFSIPPDGTIQRFAGSGALDGSYSGDGGPAVEANMASLTALAIAPDGSVYVSDSGFSTIRRILPNGIIKTVAGIPLEFDGLRDGGPAAAASVFSPQRIAVGPDGAAYVTDQFYMTARRISPPEPIANTGEYHVPSVDGGTVDIFSSTARHLRTTDAVTGVVLRQLGYDANSKPATIGDPYGNVTRIERDSEGAATAIVSPFGKRTTLTMSGDGYLESVTNPAGERVVMAYALGQVTSIRNARGITKELTYDTDGRLLSERFPDGGGTTLTREGSERNFNVTVESGEGQAVIYERQLDDVSRENRTGIDGVTGLRTSSMRDDDGGSTTLLPDGMVVTDEVTGDPRFKTLAPLRSRSVRTPGGRMLLTQLERSVTLSNKSDPLSLTAITDTLKVNGRPWKSTFTKATGALTTLSPAGRQTVTTLNAKGDIASIQVPGFAVASFTYDPQGRVTSFQMGARSSSIVYNAQDEVDRMTDALARAVSFEYDAAGRVTRQVLPDTRFIDFTYDANGNVTSVAPPARPPHGFGFTSRDLVERYTPPPSVPGGSTHFTYNRDRQLTLITRPDGETITPGYDRAGRLSSLTIGQGTYRYDYSATTGNLISILAPDGGALRYRYDGPLVTNAEWTGAVSGSISYQYDHDFRVSNENGTTFSYDADGLLIGAGALSLFRHPQNGLLTGSTVGLISESYTRNEFGEVTRYVATNGTNNLLAIEYSRDAGGRIATKTETVGSVTQASHGYQYDRSGRLTRVDRAGIAVAEYDYDANSNRIAHRFAGGSASATYDQQDRLLIYDDTLYTYSANGDLQSRTVLNVTTTFDYDVLGNLRTVQMPGRRIEYVIDAQNRRIGKMIDGVLVRGWLYADQLRVVAELNEAGAIISRFVYGSRSNAPDYMTKEGVTYRFITDHLGSPRFVVNVTDGTIAQQIEYDEFGRVLFDSNPNFQPFGFAGGLRDSDTGFVRFGARDYDPHTGRWTAKDPIGFAGGDLNLYGYTLGDPVNWIDPSGLSGLCTLGGRVPPWIRTAQEVAHAAKARGMPRVSPAPKLRQGPSRPGMPPGPDAGPTEGTPVQNPVGMQRLLKLGKEGSELIDETAPFLEQLGNLLGTAFPFLFAKPAEIHEGLASPMCETCA